MFNHVAESRNGEPTLLISCSINCLSNEYLHEVFPQEADRSDSQYKTLGRHGL